jgi:hypothetical protein
MCDITALLGSADQRLDGRIGKVGTGLSGGISETLFPGIFSLCGVTVLAMNSTIDAKSTHDTQQMSLIESIA